ncbi:hypothetical protein OJAV_G00007920 [Oryzias javanicus]|uniref:Uncharacterized protein n=1 Tax=Oryzias javanicus TaxID=123683 RepID=A0A437DN74_ORYJA|nr:hypothetical protein OJAV_G00007920 [Oryzias javanicus]
MATPTPPPDVRAGCLRMKPSCRRPDLIPWLLGVGSSALHHEPPPPDAGALTDIPRQQPPCLGCSWTGSCPSTCWCPFWFWPDSERVCTSSSPDCRMPTNGVTKQSGITR